MTIYIIAAEGDKTEYKYFKALKTQYEQHFNLGNVHVEFIDRKEEEAGNSSPRYVYKTLLKFSEELKKQWDLTEYDELWMIIDTDEYDNRRTDISEIEQICRENPMYKLGISNPCFEIWLILHFFDLETGLQDAIPGNTEDITLKDYIQNQSIKQRAKYCKKLWNMIHQRQKQPSYVQLIEYIPQAIPRAKILGECNPNDPHYPQSKIATEVYKLLEKLTQLSMNVQI